VTYIARKSIEIKLTKVDAFEKILTGLLTNGVNNVHELIFARPSCANTVTQPEQWLSAQRKKRPTRWHPNSA